ncbi:glycoside hydrolase superfamily [Polychytrium aggregatum]|uniref:glycoside hydrolase superfamily n=1 Tax=Polychytrium aggregatum TaxID=110093 RepID=UPI0022FE4155|nr:glycoside hydrolase superfamily [Polychytrium aggregatum]KAI9201796.1 glycoside hydrolase superfamily [Polychytrium aggregatum]
MVKITLAAALLGASVLGVASAQSAAGAAPLSHYLWPLPKSVVDAGQAVSVSGFWLDFSSSNAQLENVVMSAYNRFDKSAKIKKAYGGDGPTVPVKVAIQKKVQAVPAELPGIDESYTLAVTPKKVTITAATQAGAVYALQTLSQLITKDGKLRTGTITDAPRFSYRGLMLDTARNFFPVEDIKRIIDGLAYSKLNVLHWHIYDSQSFPIKWDKYPQLLNAAYKDASGKPKVYTKQDVQSIIKYAFERNVRVIPEFETPGHNAVFGHVDPSFTLDWNHSPWDGNNAEYSNTTLPGETGPVIWWGRHHCNQPPCGQLNVQNPKAMAFLDELITEIGSWFADPVVHVGHDEVNLRGYGLAPDNWDVVPQDLIHPLMREFEPKLLNILKKNKKTWASWDESLTDFGIADIVPKDGIITQWRAADAPVNALAAAGFQNIVIANSDYYYLDCSPSARWCSSDFERTVPADKYDLPGYATFSGQWHNWTKIYNFDPLADVLPQYHGNVRGGFGALWSETIKRNNLDRFAFPRVSVIGETLWSYGSVKYSEAVTPLRLERFRASLVNELNIDAATLDYLGNKEPTIYRPEICDGEGTTAPFQKTNECCFPGEPLTGGDGGPLLPPAYYEAPTDYCRIAGSYDTDAIVHNNPSPVPYPL